MKYFPIFLNIKNQPIAVVGGGDAAVAKLRLLLKTEGQITVYDDAPAPEIATWADAGLLTISRPPMSAEQARHACLIYAAAEDDSRDAATHQIAKDAGTLFNWVDNLKNSDFITPAIVDRDPVIVAIGTEGAAPVVARAIKRVIEGLLPQTLGKLAKIGQAFRPHADALPFGRVRRDFWSAFYFGSGPTAYDASGPDGAQAALNELLQVFAQQTPKQGHVDFVGAGPGDPTLLTHKARLLLDEADVVLYDRLVDPRILELARREALVIEVGKTGFGPSMAQNEINQLIIDHVGRGVQVVRLKSGDPSVFGRLDEELEAIAAHDISYSIVPGITAASAAAASLGRSLTQRDRNSGVRLITGYDMAGFADQDWRSMAAPDTVVAIYMGKKAARFIQGRLMMHGADAETPITVVENVSRADQRTISTQLKHLPQAVGNLDGPAVLLYEVNPRIKSCKIYQEQVLERCN
tara:strand:+ start:1543 stop:2937 length:1395 start_codon:yes stop_codon:yes gene_type:complete